MEGSLEEQAKCYFRVVHLRHSREAKGGFRAAGKMLFSCSLVLASYTLDTNLTKSAFSQTRYTDSDLASLEPRLFHSKQIDIVNNHSLFELDCAYVWSCSKHKDLHSVSLWSLSFLHLPKQPIPKANFNFDNFATMLVYMSNRAPNFHIGS